MEPCDQFVQEETGRGRCVTAQGNLWHDSKENVNSMTGLSPGFENASKRDTQKRKYKLEKKTTKKFKKPKLFNMQLAKGNESTKARHEIETCQNSTELTPQIDLGEIPACKEKPILSLIPANPSQEYKFIYFDLETSSPSPTCEILQISCVYDEKHFDLYVLPTENIATKVSEKIGFTFSHGKLYLHNQCVTAVTQQDALKSFITWLKEENCHPCILVAHNATGFDARKLTHNLMKHGLFDDFCSHVSGFVDTLKAYRKMFPKQKKYKQEILVTKFVGLQYEAHNSLEDCKALQKLVKTTIPNTQALLAFSFPADYAKHIVLYERPGNEYFYSLCPLVTAKVLSKAMAKRILNSGLRLTHLKLAHKKAGVDGIKQIFKEKTQDGKARVTCNKKIIKATAEYFEKAELVESDVY